MPEISRFFGIVIGIFPREHPPAISMPSTAVTKSRSILHPERLPESFRDVPFDLLKSGESSIKRNSLQTGICCKLVARPAK